jgi:ketosteroid isomerase-like protein
MFKRQILLVAGMLFVAFGHAQAQSNGEGGSLTALDYAEIQRIYAAYAHNYDSCADNGQAFARLFTPDGVFVLPNGRAIEGREKLAEFARCPSGVTRRPTQHWLSNVFISPAPEGATGTAYVMQVNAAEPKLSSSGNRYEDIFVKGPQGWAIKKHMVIPTITAPKAP